MTEKLISVQAYADHIDRVDAIAQQLQDAGMAVSDRLMAIGHFSGTADESILHKLRAIPGIAAVEVVGEPGNEPRDYRIDDV